jgi:hypothetical protein
MQSIETEYNGYKFRSRLEARWAIFFDALGIKYEYEPEGYILPDGSKYLPDFYLPDDNLFFEIKGLMNKKDFRKTAMFAKYADILIGRSDFSFYSPIDKQFFLTKDNYKIAEAIKQAKQAQFSTDVIIRLYHEPEKEHINQIDLKNAYKLLFDDSLKEYNKKQNRSDRIINDYYQHIKNSKREFAYYELVVLYDDEIILNKYLDSFKKRNPNLYIFNAVIHSNKHNAHLHIDFIPFYTKERTNSLTKGVSLRVALDEQGFTAKNVKDNHLIAWEKSEKKALFKIVNEYMYDYDDI